MLDDYSVNVTFSCVLGCLAGCSLRNMLITTGVGVVASTLVGATAETNGSLTTS